MGCSWTARVLTTAIYFYKLTTACNMRSQHDSTVHGQGPSQYWSLTVEASCYSEYIYQYSLAVHSHDWNIDIHVRGIILCFKHDNTTELPLLYIQVQHVQSDNDCSSTVLDYLDSYTCSCRTTVSKQNSNRWDNYVQRVLFQ